MGRKESLGPAGPLFVALLAPASVISPQSSDRHPDLRSPRAVLGTSGAAVVTTALRGGRRPCAAVAVGSGT